MINQAEAQHRIRLLDERRESLYRRLHSCDLCPRQCRVNRTAGQTGYCGAGSEVVVYTSFLHHGEEPAISGLKGSGTIFYSGCNLRCAYCQNYKFSHSLSGTALTVEELAGIMLGLQAKGAVNINLVTPTHFLPMVCHAISTSLRKGLSIPIVYNTSGYETEETVEALGMAVDVFLADMRYITPAMASKYSNAADYPTFNQRSLLAMFRQKEAVWHGEMLLQGLVIRHLVLPGHSDETMRVLTWIAENLPGAMVSVMFQYRPYFEANLHPEIDRCLSEAEYMQVREFLDRLDLEGWIQEFSPGEELAGVNFQPTLEGLV